MKTYSWKFVCRGIYDCSVFGMKEGLPCNDPMHPSDYCKFTLGYCGPHGIERLHVTCVLSELL